MSRMTKEERALMQAKDDASAAMFDLIERVASLNPDAGEIGAGMLAQLVGRARTIKQVIAERAASYA